MFDRGECVVKRTPDLENPELEIIEAKCICGDIFSGDDCGKEAWETILEEKLADIASLAAPPRALSAAAAAVGVVLALFF